MQSNPRNMFFIIGIVMFFVYGSHLLEVVLQPKDIWWTPEKMKEPLSSVGDRVIVYIGDEKLDTLIEEQRLLTGSDGNAVKVNPADIGFRFNNYHKVRSSKLVKSTIASALFSAGLLFLIYGMIPLIRKKQV